MRNKLHIVVTGERNDTRSFMMSKQKMQFTVLLSVAIMIVLFILSISGIKHSVENVALKSSLATLQKELQDARDWNNEFIDRVSKLEEEKELKLKNTLSELKEKTQEKETLLNSALSELKNRSKILESILKNVGINVKTEETGKNSGGPFVPLADDSLDDLTFKVDSYLETIKTIPLGPPVYGAITSQYGRRFDPINDQPAFHAGIDIRKPLGSKIYATAEGVVLEKGYTKGHGNYLVLKHGEDFKTRFFHMKKSLVNIGDRIKRGDTIGLVGNTGRSTGAHLHYEIIYQEKHTNPLKFIRIARNISPDE